MIDSAINPIARLVRRQKALGMSYPTLSETTGIPVSTLKRVLAEGSTNASLENILAIAHAMGCSLMVEEADIDAVREEQALKKARRLVALVQGTSALEGQGLSEEQIERMIEQTVHELLAGSSRKLWAS